VEADAMHAGWWLGPVDGPWAVGIALILGGAVVGTALWCWWRVRRRRLYEEIASLEHLALHDELTGVHNRRGFLLTLHQQSTRAVHWDWPIAILEVDLDHFRLVNDRHGRAVGDRALAAAGTLVREGAGPLDNVGRLHGDVFLVGAVGADLSQAKDLADRIVRRFRSHDWSEVAEGLAVTCSVGVAVVQPSRTEAPILDDLGVLLVEAERAVLEVKRHGRNGYLTHESLPAAAASSAPAG
jgi:diguanylate cyclase (GGDEF)-like protein